GSEATSDYSDSGYSTTENGGSSWTDDSYEAPAPAAPAPDPAPAPADTGGWVDSGWVPDNEKWCSWADEYGNSKLIPCP
ncbi:hypothetical protein, partial [Actinotignum sanguinis]|uniref:hypothetical protein n=1 Tax=Actinotignum sanguinis TaxID=1445614 RepID=UPI002551A4E8